jgi:hypothetical protein
MGQRKGNPIPSYQNQGYETLWSNAGARENRDMGTKPVMIDDETTLDEVVDYSGMTKGYARDSDLVDSSINASFNTLSSSGHPVVIGQLSWARYDDTQYTTSSFLSVTVAGGEVTIPNNGGYSVTTHLHSDIQFYNTGSQIVYAEKEGDVYLMTVTFRAKTANATNGWMRIQMDSAGSTPYRRVGKDLFFGKGNNVWHDFHEVFQFYADSDFVTNGNQWKINANGATVDIANVIYFIQRTQNHLI